MNKWEKVDMSIKGKRFIEPVATITKSGLCFNKPATDLLDELELLGRRGDLSECGGQFAITKGESFTVTDTSNKKSAVIARKGCCDKMFDVTRCKRFRVKQDGYYLVLTPAYDLKEK